MFYLSKKKMLIPKEIYYLEGKFPKIIPLTLWKERMWFILYHTVSYSPAGLYFKALHSREFLCLKGDLQKGYAVLSLQDTPPNLLSRVSTIPCSSYKASKLIFSFLLLQGWRRLSKCPIPLFMIMPVASVIRVISLSTSHRVLFSTVR